METIYKKIVVDTKKDILITPLGDIHEDAEACDKKALESLLKERHEMGSYFIGLGDFAEFIMPGDHRYTGRTAKGLAAQENIIDDIVEKMIKKYGKLKWLSLGCGNHELKAATRYFTDPMYRLASAIGVPYGLYCGRILLDIWDAKKQRAKCRILYHHGFGGGETAGFTQAMKWASRLPGWDLLVYGHVHQSQVRYVEFDELGANGRSMKYSAPVMACGSFLRGTVDGMITYSDKAGYPIAPTGRVPMIRIKTTNDHEERRGFEVKVEM